MQVEGIISTFQQNSYAVRADFIGSDFVLRIPKLCVFSGIESRVCPVLCLAKL